MTAETSRWYWVKDGRQVGPVSWDELQRLARVGRLRADDPVLREGSEVWQTARTARDIEVTVDEMTPDAAAAEAATLLSGAPERTNLQTPYDAAGGSSARGAAASSGRSGGSSSNNSGGIKGGRMLFGLLLCGGGVCGTLLGYNAAVTRGGGTYYVFTGPIIWGLITIARSFGGGRSPRDA